MIWEVGLGQVNRILLFTSTEGHRTLNLKKDFRFQDADKENFHLCFISFIFKLVSLFSILM